jgi:hypothetical protein
MSKEYMAAYRARNKVQPDPVICVICKKEFQPKRSSAITCSNNCRQRKWYNERKSKA